MLIILSITIITLSSFVDTLSISSSFSKIKTQENFDQVLSWIRDGGGFVHPGCKITSFPNMGFGLVCEDVKIGVCEDIIVIPPSLTLSTTLSDDKQSLIDLASSLATEMNLGKKSSFYPLINTLPTNIEEIPANYNEMKLSDLEGTSLCSDARISRDIWNSEADELIQDKSNAFNRDEYLWARSMIQSRAYRFATNQPKSYSSSSHVDDKEDDTDHETKELEKDKEGQLTVFLASVSLSNHHDDLDKVATVKRGYGKEDGYRLVSGEKAIYPGQQIFISYGDLSIQQKINSFGWIDAPCDNAVKKCVTPLTLEFKGITHEVEMETFHCTKEGFSSLESSKEEVKRIVKELCQKASNKINNNADNCDTKRSISSNSGNPSNPSNPVGNPVESEYECEASNILMRELKNRIKNIKAGALAALNHRDSNGDCDSEEEWRDLCDVIRHTEISAAEALLDAMT